MDLKKNLAVLLVKIVSQEILISGKSKRVVSGRNLFVVTQLFPRLCDVERDGCLVAHATDTTEWFDFLCN